MPATLEELLDGMAAAGRLTQLNLVKSDQGYQASIKRVEHSSSWGCFVAPTASAALRQALVDQVNAVRRTPSYWHHPESETVFVIAPGEAVPTDGQCDEIDHATFCRLHEKYGPTEDEDDDDGMDLI